MPENKTEGPHRRFELGIRIGADNMQSLTGLLRHMLWQIEDGVTNSTTGGPGSGGTVIIREDADQTHNRYFEQLNEWLAQERAQDDNV